MDTTRLTLDRYAHHRERCALQKTQTHDQGCTCGLLKAITTYEQQDATIAALQAKLAAWTDTFGHISMDAGEAGRLTRDGIAQREAKLARAQLALNEIITRAKRIREDKAVVGIEASFIEQIAKQALKETQGGA